MDVAVYTYPSSDPVLIDKIVNEFLSQGKFDKLRKECMADADTKPAYQNLQQRVESTVSQFLKKQTWKPDLNKNQLRDQLRKYILESGFLDAGINRIVDQIVNPNVLATVFMPEVEEVVYSYLSIPRPADKSQKACDTEKKTDSKCQQPEDSSKETSEIENQVSVQKTGEDPTCTLDHIKTEDVSDNSSLHDPQMDNQKETAPRPNEADVKCEVEDVPTDHDAGYASYTAKEECKTETVLEEGSDSKEKMEVPSDESQESLSRMGVERLRLSESDGLNAPDSDASLPLEINEKSMSDSRDSDDSIMNKMSPISQGRLTPEEPQPIVEEVKEEKTEKKPLTFIGRIPKLNRNDSGASKKDETLRRDKLSVKSVYSSDESDSSKHSFIGKDDYDDKSKDKRRESKSESSSKSDRKYKDDDDRKRSGSDKRYDHRKSSDGKSHNRDGRSSRDDKSRSRRDDKDKSHSRSRDERRGKSRDKQSSDKRSSSSSHSRSKSSSHHKSGHKSESHDKEPRRRDSRSRDRDRDRDRSSSRHDRKDRDKRNLDRRKREEEKRKKSKSVDDHGKERNKRDDRRSTDRDSNERERDKPKDSESSRSGHSEGRKREKDHKGDGAKKERTQKEEGDTKGKGSASDATETTKAEVVRNDGHDEKVRVEAVVVTVAEDKEVLNFGDLYKRGALIKKVFPKLVDDFYVKFDSTGFRYFEDWETTKLDCEEEFKEYIDEAEKDLSLLSDDGSDYEDGVEHAASEERRKNVVTDSCRGLGNFSDCLMFDPVSCDFFKWTSAKFYREHGGTQSGCGADGDVSGSIKSNQRGNMTEEDDIKCLAEKNKENRRRGKRVRNSLKFLNRYHRKIGLKFKYGKEQHRFARRLKKSLSSTGDKSQTLEDSVDVNGLKLKNVQEIFGRNGVGHAVDAERVPWAVLQNVIPSYETDGKAGKDVLRECLDSRHNLIRSSQGSSRDPEPYPLIIETEVEEVVTAEDLNQMSRVSFADDRSTRSSGEASTPKLDVEAKMRRSKESLTRFGSGERTDGEDERESAMGTVCSQRNPLLDTKKRGLRIGLSKAKMPKAVESAGTDVQRKANQNFNLPLSPESDDSMFGNNGVVTSQKKQARKRAGDDATGFGGVTQEKRLKDCKRAMSQKYDSQDLYKPRPFSVGSKTRGRVGARGDGAQDGVRTSSVDL